MCKVFSTFVRNYDCIACDSKRFIESPRTNKSTLFLSFTILKTTVACKHKLHNATISLMLICSSWSIYLSEVSADSAVPRKQHMHSELLVMSDKVLDISLAWIEAQFPSGTSDHCVPPGEGALLLLIAAARSLAEIPGSSFSAGFVLSDLLPTTISSLLWDNPQ